MSVELLMSDVNPMENLELVVDSGVEIYMHYIAPTMIGGSIV